MEQSPVIIFTAFEPSGDAHAAPVIARLRTRLPTIGFGRVVAQREQPRPGTVHRKQSRAPAIPRQRARESDQGEHQHGGHCDLKASAAERDLRNRGVELQVARDLKAQ